MKRQLLLAVLVCSISAWGQQAPPDCSTGFCAGVGSPMTPHIPCKAGNKYTQLDAPGTGWSCTGVPPNWVQDSGSGGGSPAWSAITNPASNLSLTMGANSTTYSSANIFSTPGTFQSPWKYAGNGLNFSTTWNALYGTSLFPSDEVDVGLAVPNTTTAFQSNAFASFATCAEPSGNFFCVSMYAQANRVAAGSFTHAFNANVTDNNLGSGFSLFSGEFNSQVHNVTSGGASLLISANIDNAGTPYDAIDVMPTSDPSPFPYRTGLDFGDGSSSTAIHIGSAFTGTGSMPVTMTSSLGTGTYSYDGLGNFAFSGPVIAPNTPLSPGTSVTDNFARSAGALGANWSGGSTIPIISSGVVGSTSGAANDFAWYTGSGTFSTNQCSSVTIQAVGSSGNWAASVVNAQDINNSYALLSFNQGASPAQFQLTKIVANVGNTLITQRNYSTGGAMLVGDVFKLCRSGSTLTVSRNGVAEATTATDTTFSTGFPGIGFNQSTPIRISSFTGTGLNSTAINIGGTFAAAGCTDFTAATVTNATTTMACVMTGQGGNPANVSPTCAVTAANTVTPRLCSFTAQTVTAQNYSVRVIP